MKENETLKYFQEGMFNSDNLKAYDTEGQKYFLGYLFRKGYNFTIKDGEIEFKDIKCEDKVKEVIEKYNRESLIENLNIKRQSVRAIRVMGIEEYSQTIEKKLRNMKEREKALKER